ncbi:outer membrane protein assembly factor BamB [Vibrio sp. V27_P1S3P104]|uniref:outer membrane protein assembly factor BamB n=1 Tax=unclassified Vibrio TaxID=2614977 RepID=UPI00137318DE|nr:MULTISPECIES: outer membrane protein assembly factor BamB [unclassified Vibrio]NAW70663.1 outer membrane protein assembly factor BamB [Vibrio sp. V28_P6S34P95]NAX05068.1 outer membrane protein assembly factor BamB [Vibrio sp. V30_P3S12P165]NAX34809.1 outer membrane protein assembly factor BamB [Vibrio sp. V29_P1S30P107]NAX36879.1 outer membrane protein assembly factor BamB [Vibrio sp. V27_P1S3P104]NAX40353.1 outer membrane protein assembly factor BamB [Vibrio sp. V26_P1S5P106]
MKKMFNKVLLSAAMLGALVGCSGEEENIIMAPLPLVKSEFTPQSVWRSSIGDGVGHYFSNLAPEYAYDKIFVANREGEVKALNPENGQPFWRVRLQGDVPARLSGGITAAYGQLFIGSENGEVIALDAESGNVNWRANIEGEVLAPVAADNNFIIANSSRGILVALDASTGEQKWTISTDVPSLTLRGDSQPVTTSGGVFWGTPSGRLAAAIVERGQLIWQLPVGQPKGATEIDRLVDVDAAPLIIGANLYTIGFNGQLMAIDLRSGNPLWKRNYSSTTNMASDGSRLFLITDKDHVVAVDARSGTELWSNKQLEHRLLTAPKIIDGYVVVGDSEGYLHWFDRGSGEFVAQQLIHKSGFAVGPLALDDGYLVITRDGKIKKLTIRQ